MFLALYLIALSLFVLYLFLRFKMQKVSQFDTIKAKKVEIIQSDGKPALILFNSENIPPPIIEGKRYPSNLRNIGLNANGIVFYNNNGDEIGGIVFGSKKDENGNVYQGIHISFDAFQQDEVFHIDCSQYGGERWLEINAFYQPEKSLKPMFEKLTEINSIQDTSERKRKMKEFENWKEKEYGKMYIPIFSIKNENGKAGIELYDKRGNLRIRLYIDEDENPRLEFYDTNGKVIKSL
ncbi:hypothetical protein J7K43_07605 [Candidatus Calescamantes bacterium]|nr:hypothetical protein [Candidatus Calescamantes bacterium]